MAQPDRNQSVIAECDMSRKQIIILLVLALADFGVLGLGAIILLSGSRAASPALFTPQIIEPPTLTPTSVFNLTVTLPPSETPVPTETRWPTWTPRPTRTLIPTVTPTPTATPTMTPKPTPKPSAGSPASPVDSGCDNPDRGEPLAGRLEADITHISWRQASDDPLYAIGTIEIYVSGGGGCYKYDLAGRRYTRRPLEFRMNKCGTATLTLKITSADGQVWSKDFQISADDPVFECGGKRKPDD